MKRIGKFFLLLLTAALFAYLVTMDYPSTMRSLIPKQDMTATAEGQADSATGVETQSEDTSQEPEPDIKALKAQISQTKTTLLVGSIRQGVYDTIYPTLNDAGYTGILLFSNGHLTGDYEQMSTNQFQGLVDSGWDFAMGGIDSELSGEDWRSALLEEIERIERRSGVRPTVYSFQPGEYSSEREEILQEEGFSALYYAVQDETAAETGNSDLRKACCIPFSEEEDFQVLLDQAWSQESVAFGTEIDSGAEEISAETWSELLSMLTVDDRFAVMSQADWLNTELENNPDRAEQVAAVLAAGDTE